MRTTPVLSALELAILGSIRWRPSSGYDIRKSFTLSSMPLGDSPGAVYPALRRLRKAGLLDVVADRTSARSKEVFHLTSAGRRTLQQSAAAAISADEVSTDPERLLLRAAALDERDAAEFLTRYAAAMREHAAELRERAARPWPESLVVDYAIAMYVARARWADRALSRRRQS
jgi:DNA-binding PadR family transcriptional regulator